MIATYAAGSFDSVRSAAAKRHNAKRNASRSMSEADAACLAVIRSGGPRGVDLDAILVVLSPKRERQAAQNLMARLRRSGVRAVAQRVGHDGDRHVYRYIDLDAPAVPAEGRPMAADLGIVAVPGLGGVSVARVTGWGA